MRPAAQTYVPSARTLGALFVAAVATHLPALANGFAFDDAFILANPAIQSLRTLPGAFASPWWYTSNHLYRPLTLATFGFGRILAGTNPVVPHAVNIALHGCVVMLLVRLLGRFLPAVAAIAGALLFAVLPVHAESVASVVGRAELLSALALLALLLLVTGDALPSRRERLLACVLGAVALASKETGVVAPALAYAAALAVPRQRAQAFRWAASTAVGTLVLLTARLQVLGTFGGDLPNPVFRVLTDWERIGAALSMMPRALAMLVLPVRPALDYVPTLGKLQHPDPLALIGGAVVVLLVTLAVAWHVRRPSVTGLGSWIAALAFLPTANLLFASGVVLTGRTLYAPSIGAALIVAAVIARASSTRLGGALKVAFGVMLVVAASVSWRESSVWRSSESVIAEMQQRHPENYRSFMLLAYMARDHGRDVEAVAQFREAVKRFPADPEMLTDGATVALRLHDTVTARAWLEGAIAASPRAARSRTRLVSVLLASYDTAGARQLLVEGLEQEPAQAVWAIELQALDERR